MVNQIATLKQNIYRHSKYKIVNWILSKEGNLAGKKLLDLGCRDNILKSFLPENLEYVGLDLFQNDHNGVHIVQNVEDGISLPDNSIDYIVALDIFEHLNQFQEVLDDVVRICKNKIIIALPNMSYFPLRYDYFFRGKFTITDKYKLSHKYGLDRHRWVTFFDDADEFFAEYCTENQLQLDKYCIVDNAKFFSFRKVLSAIGVRPGFYTRNCIYLLTK